MADKWCMWFDELTREDVALAGGKGANLGDMAQLRLPVPPGFVVTAPAYRHVINTTDVAAKIDDLLQKLDRSSCDELQEVEPRLRALFTDVAVPAELEQTIVACYRELGANLPVAVRSSATAEDLAGASFAGQQETYLNVIGDEALICAVRRCWSSLFTSQAIFYRCQHGFQDREVSMAVVVQKMVDSEKAGVSFTVDPVLRNHYQMVVEGVWGLGEGIVSGEITPDHYKLDRETCEIVFEYIPEKKIMFRQDRAGGVVKLPVPPARVTARVLTEHELRQLVELGNRAEEHFGCPQDIEWAIENEAVYLLQSRPITCL
jgi:pyruvate, water dikinase